MSHQFGGLWTQKKLEILGRYLAFYTNALKNLPFKLHYADAFAGTGTHRQKTDDDQGDLIPQIDLKGSVTYALDIKPGFHYYHFNDLKPEHVAELHEIKSSNPDKNIIISELDANIFVPDFCKNLSRMDRAVLFIDPYNTEFNWETIEVIAKSGKVDLWLLFPLSVILRMTPKDGAKIIPEWEQTLNRLLGTKEWEDALYKPKEKPMMDDMFQAIENSGDDLMERINPIELQNWVKGRLESIFSFVAEPVMLKNNNRPLFLFFFAVSNPSPAAKALAQKVANQIIKKFK